MYIFVVNFKIKSSATEDDLIRLHDEIVAPIYSRTPGCKGTYLIKYIGRDDESPEWDYAAIEVWDSKEAKEKALSEGTGSYNNQLNQKGFYDKFFSMVEKSSMSNAIPLAFSKSE